MIFMRWDINGYMPSGVIQPGSGAPDKMGDLPNATIDDWMLCTYMGFPEIWVPSKSSTFMEISAITIHLGVPIDGNPHILRTSFCGETVDFHH